MSFDFTGKKVLVTGAAGGIGRGLTNAFVEAGAEVFALDFNKDSLESLAEEVPGIHTVLVDLADWGAAREAVDKLDPFDGVVNCAGIIATSVSALETSREELEKVLKVDLLAAINVTQSVGNKMVAAGKGGSIVNISSVCGLNPVKELLAYTVAKAGLDMVTKQFALELGPHNIRVNSVNPTGTLTSFLKGYLEIKPDTLDALNSCTPLGRVAEVAEVVDVIMFLLSDRSTMVTGTTIRIDGGLLSNIPI